MDDIYFLNNEGIKMHALGCKVIKISRQMIVQQLNVSKKQFFLMESS